MESQTPTLPNIRLERNSFFHLNKLIPPELKHLHEFVVDVLMFVSYTSQQQHKNLFNQLEFTSNDFLKFTKRSKSTLFSSFVSDKQYEVEVNGRIIVLKNTFEYILHLLASEKINLSDIYQKHELSVVHFQYDFFLTYFTISESSSNTKQRLYGIKINPFFDNSLLRQYTIVNPNDISKLRGKRNSSVMLYTELLRRKIASGNNDTFTIYYPTLKNICNIDIQCYNNSKNISSTIIKIKKQIEEIKEKTSLNVEYKVHPTDNAFTFRIKSDTKKISDQMHFFIISNSLRQTLESFLLSAQVLSITKLNEEEKMHLLHDLCANFEAHISDFEYQALFENTVSDVCSRQIEFKFIHEECSRRKTAYLEELKRKNYLKKLNN